MVLWLTEDESEIYLISVPPETKDSLVYLLKKIKGESIVSSVPEKPEPAPQPKPENIEKPIVPSGEPIKYEADVVNLSPKTQLVKPQAEEQKTVSKRRFNVTLGNVKLKAQVF